MINEVITPCGLCRGKGIDPHTDQDCDRCDGKGFTDVPTSYPMKLE